MIHVFQNHKTVFGKFYLILSIFISEIKPSIDIELCILFSKNHWQFYLLDV